MNDSISVICPVYNSRRFILKAIDSIINQSNYPYELIIVDDGSVDDTYNFLKEYLGKLNLKFTYKIFRVKHKGPGAARNKGVREARGKWISFIDSDDIWSKDKISEMKKIIRSNDSTNFICHNEVFVSLTGEKKKLDYFSKYKPSEELVKQLFNQNLFSTSAVTCKKRLFNDIGYFDENLLSSQDYDLWLKFSEKINLYFSKKYLGFYIQRSGNISSGNWFFRLKNEIIIINRYRYFVNNNIVFKRLLILIMASLYNLLKR